MFATPGHMRFDMGAEVRVDESTNLQPICLGVVRSLAGIDDSGGMHRPSEFQHPVDDRVRIGEPVSSLGEFLVRHGVTHLQEQIDRKPGVVDRDRPVLASVLVKDRYVP